MGRPCPADIDVMQKIVIFGQLKTGTTGLFYKIKNSLPDNTRTLFEPSEYIPEANDKNLFVLAKTILDYMPAMQPLQYHTFMDFDKQIYITRDPRDRMISALLYLIQWSSNDYSAIYNNDRKLQEIMMLLRRKEADPESLPMIRIFEQVILTIFNFSLEELRGWMTSLYHRLFEFEVQLGRSFILRYEDFVDDNIDALEDYMNLSLHGQAVVADIHSEVTRTKRYGEWPNWFLEEDIDYFKPILSDYIRRHGYSDNWHIKRRKSINPEFCSKYVERTVNRRRTLKNYHQKVP